MSGLERSYRRLLRLYPRRYRAGREEEMLAVLLDAAAPGQERASAGDAADLALGAVRARSADGARLARERPAAAAGWAVLCAGLLAAVLPPSTPAPAQPESLPSRFAGYSHLTGSVSSSPPGPAVALYQQGWGVELADFPQAVVVGASGAYRRLDVAEERSAPADQGDPAPMLLSPDGARVAVGDHEAGSARDAGSGARADVAVQDLTTGEVRRLDAGIGAGVVPLAWSADGGSLIVAVADAPLNPYAGLTDPPPDGRPIVLDAGTGAAAPLPLTGVGPVRAAAFSPDGARAAVQRRSGEVVLVDLAARTQESLGGNGDVLAGSSAWSPDGEMLATDGPECTGFVSTGAAPPPPCVPHPQGGQRFVGWAGPRSVAVVTDTSTDGTSADPSLIVVVDVDTGQRTTVSGIATEEGNYAVSRLQVASTALTGAVSRPATTDRGPWPLGLRLVAAAALAAVTGRVTATAVSRVRRRRQRLRAVAPRPPAGLNR